MQTACRCAPARCQRPMLNAVAPLCLRCAAAGRLRHHAGSSPSRRRRLPRHHRPRRPPVGQLPARTASPKPCPASSAGSQKPATASTSAWPRRSARPSPRSRVTPESATLTQADQAPRVAQRHRHADRADARLVAAGVGPARLAAGLRHRRRRQALRRLAGQQHGHHRRRLAPAFVSWQDETAAQPAPKRIDAERSASRHAPTNWRSASSSTRRAEHDATFPARLPGAGQAQPVPARDRPPRRRLPPAANACSS